MDSNADACDEKRMKRMYMYRDTKKNDTVTGVKMIGALKGSGPPFKLELL